MWHEKGRKGLMVINTKDENMCDQNSFRLEQHTHVPDILHIFESTTEGLAAEQSSVQLLAPPPAEFVGIVFKL